MGDTGPVHSQESPQNQGVSTQLVRNLVRRLAPTELAGLVGGLSADDLARLVDALPAEVKRRLSSLLG